MTASTVSDAAPVEAGPVARERRTFAPSIEQLFVLMFAVGGWCAGLRRLGDNSFLWHFRTGRLILDEGIPRHDPYSFTARGVKWVSQSWLAELAYGLLDRAWGPFAVRLLIAATGSGIATGLYLLARREARDRVRAASVAVLALVAIRTIWSERPLLLGLLAMVALVGIVGARPGSRLERAGPFLLVPLLWVWGNVHGTFPLGILYIGLVLIGRWTEGRRPWSNGEGRLLAGTAVGSLLILANPYFVDLVLFPLRLLGRGEVLDTVAEWQSPDFRDVQGMIFAAWIVLAIVLFARKSATRAELIVAIPFLLLGLWSLRNIGIAVVATLPIVASKCRTEREPPDDRSPLGLAIAAGLLVLAVAWTASAAGEPDFDLERYPVDALQHLEDEGLLGQRLFTTDSWAGYTIARSWPEQRIFMDDRYDTFPLDVIDDYDTVAGVEPGWERVLDRWDIDVVVWPRERALSEALRLSDGWRRDYRDDDAVVFVRR